jgi:NAD(P)-dependent dehydrogenase (short-subunit alcohol dehydrogenase family)
MNVRNKVIVVTGAGGGLGRELVLGLLAKGAKVIALDKDGEGLAQTHKSAQIVNISQHGRIFAGAGSNDILR